MHLSDTSERLKDDFEDPRTRTTKPLTVTDWKVTLIHAASVKTSLRRGLLLVLAGLSHAKFPWPCCDVCVMTEVRELERKVCV